LEPATPRVLGVDDFAFRKGYRYGTLLIDMQSRRPTDLLPDREGATLQAWLQAHPGVEIITRDRGATYIEAIDTAAPEAQQVADRFHLLQNLAEAFTNWLGRQMPQLHKALLPQQEPVLLTRHVARVERHRSQSRQRREAHYEHVHQLRARGLTISQIAALVGICGKTVETYLHAPVFPERKARPPTPTKLDRFVPYLYRRWSEGCHNALQLWRELQQQGLRCSATAVRDLVRPWRTALPPDVLAAARCVPLPRPKPLTWLLIQSETKWSQEQRPVREQLLACCPEVTQARRLVHAFFELARKRGGASGLDAWLEQAKQSGLKDFVCFARGMERDRAAVVAGLCCPWSNGPTEGHVNRLKFLKRQGYGRASFDLLRARVLDRAA
jgi:transposase